jgi:hypothetical protein
MIVGFIDPVGTSFQSAMTDRKEVAIKIATTILNPQPRQNKYSFRFHS